MGPRSLAAAALALAACTADLPDVDCTPPVPTYGEVHAFSISCTNCHASTLTGASRFGAPATVNFDTFAGAQPHAEEAARRVFAGEMPRTGRISDADKQTLYAWALCGTPQ